MISIPDLLELSTTHLPTQFADQLDQQPGISAWHTIHGWIMRTAYTDAAQADSTKQVDDQIRVIQQYAHSLGCDQVIFTDDGDIIDALPTWK